MKDAGATFKFFCEKSTKVSFKAMVNTGATYAFIWLDSNPSYFWDMRSKSLLAVNETEAPEVDEPEAIPAEELTAATEALPAKEEMTDATEHFVAEAADESVDVRDADASQGLRLSNPSKSFSVAGGEHEVIFQGRPEDKSTFSFSELSLDEGKDVCKFYLDGKDRTAQECNR
jgi:hypothetical protein